MLRYESRFVILPIILTLVGCSPDTVNSPATQIVRGKAQAVVYAWNTFAPLPYPRSGTGSAAIGNDLYVIGGGYAGVADLVTLAYNTASNSWVRKADSPQGRAYPMVGALNGKIIVAGGCLNNGDCYFTTNSVDVYDVATDSWTPGPSMLTARSDAAGVVANGKFWVIGGRGNQSGNYYTIGAVESFDPVTNQWTSHAAMPNPRLIEAFAVYEGKIYLIGGDDRTNPALTLVESYDPVSGQWTTLAPLPRRIGGSGAGVLNGKIYVVAGFEINESTGFQQSNRVLVYDPPTNTWTEGPPIPTGRYAPRPQAIGGTLYVAGNGWQNQGSTTLEGLAPRDDPSSKEQCLKGGWAAFGFKDQGQCVRFAETGKDSR